VLIAVNGVQKVENTDYTVNYTTGVVTFTVAPTNGHAVTAGFLFDVPVRFDQGADETLSLSINAFDSGDAALNLVEVLEEGEFGEDFFYGGAREISSAADLALTVSLGRVQAIQMTATGKKVKLPNTTGVPHGGPVFYILNVGSNTFEIQKHDGSALSPVMNVAAGQLVIVTLSKDNAGNPVWYVA
jgi:hypothetical protein